MHSVLVYRGTSNLGDALQTVALSRLLGTKLQGIYRDGVDKMLPSGDVFVVNGWIGESAPKHHPDTLFAGVYLGRNPEQMLAWIKTSRFAVGSRDPQTQAGLSRRGIYSYLCRCATLTFEPYRGPRRGRYVIDVPATPLSSGAIALTNTIPVNLPWPAQWKLALERLELLRRAEIVYTNRLHVALPCLAFGTPVFVHQFDAQRTDQPDRFSVLTEIGFAFDEACVLDVSTYAEQYLRFLSRNLNQPIRIDAPVYPAPAAASMSQTD